VLVFLMARWYGPFPRWEMENRIVRLTQLEGGWGFGGLRPPKHPHFSLNCVTHK
jgi:hypothetical protein